MRDQIISFAKNRYFKKTFFVILALTHMLCVTREELQGEILTFEIRQFFRP